MTKEMHPAYQLACEWRDKCKSAEAEVERLRADKDAMEHRLEIAGKDIEALERVIDRKNTQLAQLNAEYEGYVKGVMENASATPPADGHSLVDCIERVTSACLAAEKYIELGSLTTGEVVFGNGLHMSAGEAAMLLTPTNQAEQEAARAQLEAEKCLAAWGEQIAACEDVTACNKLEQESLPSAPQNLRSKILEMILARRTAIRGKRGK